MIGQKNEISNSKGNRIEDNEHIKNNINNKLCIKKNNIVMNYLFLILFIIRIIILIIFLFLFEKNTKIFTNSNNSKNNNICEYGFFLPEDNQTKCIKCSLEGCMECIGSKLNNTCNKCNPGLNTFYKDNKIISCSLNGKGEGYNVDDEFINYTFKAIYKSYFPEILLINNETSTEIIQMIIDGKNVTPSFSYSFNDTENHEIFMLLDTTNDLSSLFEGITSMISISFSPYFNTSNVVDMSHMFAHCYSLESINLSNFDTSKVTDMSYMFYLCHYLTSINLSNFNTSNLVDMNHMFVDIEFIKSIDISNFDTSKVTDMSFIFDSCDGLESIDLSNLNTSKVTNMSSLFLGCTSLKSINLSNIDTSNVNDMRYMFVGCFSLTSINLSNFNTSNVNDMSYMFASCSSLHYINILHFSSSESIYLFDENIPSNGTIIINSNFKNNINTDYIEGWEIKIIY